MDSTFKYSKTQGKSFKNESSPILIKIDTKDNSGTEISNMGSVLKNFVVSTVNSTFKYSKT